MNLYKVEVTTTNGKKEQFLIAAHDADEAHLIAVNDEHFDNRHLHISCTVTQKIKKIA